MYRALLFGLQASADRNRSGFLHIGLAQKLRRFFWRRGIDIEPGSPLESRRLGELRHELDVPVIVVVSRILHRRRMNHQIVRGVVKHAISPTQQIFHGTRQVLERTTAERYGVAFDLRGHGASDHSGPFGAENYADDPHTIAHARNFLDCIKSRQKPVSDLEIGFYATLPCLLGVMAVREGRSFKWDDQALKAVREVISKKDLGLR